MNGPGDTIAAIASAASGGARGIVRVSGPGTRNVLERVLGAWPGCGAHARLGFTLKGGVSLPVSVLAFEAPRSYTGEDAAEILTVGNPLVLRRVLERLIESGARQAEPGAFTARAHLAGKLSLPQAESIGARIAAERDDELDAADRVRSGAFGRRCVEWADRLASLLALVEAGIDFTDQEDVVAITPRDLATGLGALASDLVSTLGGERGVESHAAAPTAVLVGSPNAGKSTLFNALVGWERAVVADVAGTTRDAIAETIDLGHGTLVRLVDLPGLDETVEGAGADRAAQRASRQAVSSADLVIDCDPRGRFGSVEAEPGRPVLRVRTKGDLLGRGDGRGEDLVVCALDGWHLDALRRAIADAAERRGAGDAVVPRHRRSLRIAATAIRDARDAFDAEARHLGEPESVAASLRVALDEIGSVAGAVTPDEILGRVFATFCVGK